MIRKICYIGNPILRKKCRPVEEVNDEIRKIAQDLVDSMKAHNGVGLAAPQIGIDLRMFAICLSDENDEDGYGYETDPKVFINPKITRFSTDEVMMVDPCLSVPGLYEEVSRPVGIDVEALGVDGKLFKEKGLKNWRSRCIQHEVDHLNGVLMIDRYDPTLKDKYKHQLLVMEKQNQEASIITKDLFF